MSLAAAAGLLLGAGAAVAPAVQAWGYRKRDGGSVATGRRNARKARNQARNRAAHR